MAITDKFIADALKELSRKDLDLRRVLGAVGNPPNPYREPGFATLIGIITAQQISAAAASAILNRLIATVAPLSPENFLRFDKGILTVLGLSSRKIEYSRLLAQAIVSGDFDPEELIDLTEDQAVERLIQIKGIGRWSAEIYLLFALGRADVWPADDLAVVTAVKHLKGLKERPNRDLMEAIAEPWRPWRGIVALLMWQYYSSEKFSDDSLPK